MPRRKANQPWWADGQGPVLKRLQEQCYEFRRGGRPWSQVPTWLRDAVLAALDDGFAAEDLRETCGIPASQLARWVSQPKPPKPPTTSRLPGNELKSARVLRVIDCPESSAVSEDVELTVRVGQWQLSLRLAGK